MTRLLPIAILLATAVSVPAAEKPPIYLWLEPEWFDGVKGHFAYWTGEAKPTGSWGIAGPGISAEWTQRGESEWNSVGAPATETKASCGRDLVIPRAGEYRVWVRYVDHRKKTELFTLTLTQGGKPAISSEFGMKPVVPANDEYQLYWGFSFGWGAIEGTLAEGPARIELVIDKAGEGWRQVDAICITDDPAFTPVGREKPPFAYLRSFALQPSDGAAWRGSAKELTTAPPVRPKLAGRDFSMWIQVETDPRWWGEQTLDSLMKYDVFFRFSPPQDIRDKFHKEFAGRKDLPILSWPGLTPGLYLGATPDLSPGTPLRTWLERTKMPFYILTNYASGNYDEKTGPATFAALTGPLADQFLGYGHGEAIGTGGVTPPTEPLGPTRREHVDRLGTQLLKKQAEAWSKIYKTAVPESHWSKGISCLSVDSIALAHLSHETGAKVVGYEIDATNAHAPMRIAFERGAARQYGGAWINYTSGNFGDACNYFTQNPVVPRGAPGWFHSKYATTDGVSVGWYRKLYYLNYLSGASAIFWEQGLGNQWMLPGPGKHPIQLSPFGRATEDFMAFVDRIPDRGEPVAPVGLLLSYGHAYERVNYHCKMLNVFPESDADRELRELFSVCWHPAGVVEGLPAAPDVQSLPNGRYGNMFDVLVDRPAKADAIFNYPVVWAAGDVDLAPLTNTLEEYVRKGGTLVVNVNAARGLPKDLLGMWIGPVTHRAESWEPTGGEARPATPFGVVGVVLTGAMVLALADVHPLVTRHKVGAGSVIVTLVPRTIGLDERAHPALPWLMNGLTAGLLPVEVRMPDGSRPSGEILYQVNRTKDGNLVLLMNNRGVDKSQSGVARVDRRQSVDVVVRTALPVRSAKEYTEPRDLAFADGQVRVTVHPGDVQVVGLVTR
jgi:hypothetical protein